MKKSKPYYGILNTCTKCGGKTEKKRVHYYGGIKCLKCQKELRKEYRIKNKEKRAMYALNRKLMEKEKKRITISTSQIKWLSEHGDRDIRDLYRDENEKDLYVFMWGKLGFYERVYLPKKFV